LYYSTKAIPIIFKDGPLSAPHILQPFLWLRLPYVIAAVVDPFCTLRIVLVWKGFSIASF
jgi:hypothetical protein